LLNRRFHYFGSILKKPSADNRRQMASLFL
jgi:hypothetical protein